MEAAFKSNPDLIKVFTEGASIRFMDQFPLANITDKEAQGYLASLTPKKGKRSDNEELITFLNKQMETLWRGINNRKTKEEE